MSERGVKGRGHASARPPAPLCAPTMRPDTYTRAATPTLAVLFLPSYTYLSTRQLAMEVIVGGVAVGGEERWSLKLCAKDEASRSKWLKVRARTTISVIACPPSSCSSSASSLERRRQ